MPAQVVVVLQDPDLTGELAQSIGVNGHTVQPFTDPMAALNALERAETVALLITSVRFSPGKPNGGSLAMMARQKRPGIELIFICEAEDEQYVADLGLCLPPPVDVPTITELAGQLLARNQETKKPR